MTLTGSTWLALARKASPLLALSLFFLIAAAAGAVALGWVEVRRPQPPPQPAASAVTPQATPDSPQKVARSARPSVERAREQEDAFLALASQALVFRYHGGAVRCWVETVTGEKNKRVLGEVRAERGTDSGVIVWLKQEGRESKMEADGTFSTPQWWDLGIRAKAAAASGGTWWSVSRLMNQKFEYPAPKPEDVKDAPASGGGPSVGTDGALEGVVELKAGEPVSLYVRSMTSRLRGGMYDGKEVTETFSLLCELLAPQEKGVGNK